MGPSVASPGADAVPGSTVPTWAPRARRRRWLRALAGGSRGALRPWRVPILMYHRITAAAEPHPYSLVVRDFRRQLALLRGLGFRTVSPVEVADAIRRGDPLAGRPVAITFDDGYQDTLSVALPVLQEFGFTATCYFVAGRVGKSCDWTDPARLMDWPEALAWVAAGMGVGCHSMTHQDLTTLTTADAREEIASSRAYLEERLGVPVPSFAYPFNRVGRRERDLVAEAGYRAGCAGPELQRSVFALTRVSGASRSLGWFAVQLMPAYPELRQLYRRVVLRRGASEDPAPLPDGLERSCSPPP